MSVAMFSFSLSRYIRFWSCEASEAQFHVKKPYFMQETKNLVNQELQIYDHKNLICGYFSLYKIGLSAWDTRISKEKKMLVKPWRENGIRNSKTISSCPFFSKT